MKTVTAYMAAVLVCCISCLSPAVADTASDQKIGLVLAGGGARGLAHVGVIRYLEENNIKISAIAGTSMGSVVGGLYASGLNADQIAEIVKNLDWAAAFDDSTPRDQLTFRRKQDDYDFLVNGKLRFKDGKLKLPLGLVQGQHLNLLLHDLVGHVSDIHDFDQLPIPFRAVAADIVTGDAVVLSQGDLAVAMRASMSIPGFFAPIDLDGKLLVDGGIAKNIPVDVVQGMGMDRLIVIDIGTPLGGREAMENVLSLIGQLTTIMTRKNSEEQIALMGPNDILLIPDLDKAGVETMAFDKAEEAIQLGYEAASAMGNQLASFASPGNTQVGKAAVIIEAAPIIARIEVHTDSEISPELLRNKIAQAIGKPLDKAQIEHDIADIYGLDDFSRVDYTVSQNEDEHILIVRATANPAGSKYLQLGLSWDQDSKGDSAFAVGASWRAKGLNRLGGEWYTRINLGGNSAFQTEFYQPLDINQRFFVDMNYQFDQRDVNLTENRQILARAEVESHLVEFSPGINISNIAVFRIGAFGQTAETDIQIGAPELSSASSDDGGYFAEVLYDTLDRPFFPGSGLRVRSRYQTGDEDWGADAGYDSWSTSAFGAVSFGAHSLSALVRWNELDLDDPIAETTIPTQVFSLGGLFALSGYTRDSLAGNYLGQGSLIYYHRMNQQSLLPVDFPVYFGASIEGANVWLDQEDADIGDLIYAGSLFLGVDSPLGPVYLGVGIAENDQRALYLQLGQIFD